MVGHAHFEVACERVLEWYTIDDNAPAVMPLKLHISNDWASRAGEEDRTPSLVAGLLVLLQLEGSLGQGLGLDEEKFVVKDPLEDARLVPFDQNELKVLVRWKVADYAIRCNRRHLKYEIAEVPNDTCVFPLIMFAAHFQLVSSFGHDVGSESSHFLTHCKASHFG